MNTKNKNIIKTIGLLVLGLFLGWLIFGGKTSPEQADLHNHDDTETIWTCSMHPQIQQSEPGACPLCAMDLIPMQKETANNDPSVFVMSENAQRLANVSTMVIGKNAAERSIRLNGKVQVDERNSYSQTTHIPGRIEQLRINFTGEKVSRGQTLAQIYSPELVTAQQELLQAYAISASQPELFEAAKTKLRNWKISKAQIDQIISNKKPLERFSIQADVSGVVTKKNVELGDYVERGMSLYEIADLSKLWVLFDVYESEMAWVKEGSKISYTINSFPGETFEGTVSFVDPLLNSQTRVATARVEISNNDGKLKPEMFASGVVQIASEQTGIDEIVIPKSAVLWTGKRAIVYVKKDNGFEMREVTLGAGLGDNYMVKSGLTEGEEVVVNGVFTIDAAVQLSGRPSMMSPDGGGGNVGHNHGAITPTTNFSFEPTSLSAKAKKTLEPVFEAYFSFKEHLAEDDFENGKSAGIAFKAILEKVGEQSFEGESLKQWQQFSNNLESNTQHLAHATDMKSLRAQFLQISEVMVAITKTFGAPSEAIYLQHCPMADSDNGADWLSLSKEIKNPYFGSAMLKCGEVKEIINEYK